MALTTLLIVLFIFQSPDAFEYAKTGKRYYLAGDFRKSTEALRIAAKLEPNSSLHQLWLGRAYGRLAEDSGFISAPKYALQSCSHFEKAVELAPENLEVINDLFDYYLNAPHFLGGGVEKAEILANKMAGLNEAEGHHANARLAEKMKKFKEAEEHFREAIRLEPESIYKLLDLARFLARRSRIDESDEVLKKAERLFPDHPDALFARAEIYIQSGRNLNMAQEMLEHYLLLRLFLRLDESHPAPFEVERLLKKIPKN